MANPAINVLLGDSALCDPVQLSSATWTTRVKDGKKRHYENAIFKARRHETGRDVRIVALRWDSNPDWDIRLRIDECRVMEINTKCSLIAYKTGKFTSVSNGYQIISRIEEKIPMNQPRRLREFAKWVLED
jgi:hypothetical protein